MSLAREIALDVLVRYDAGDVFLRQALEEAFGRTPLLARRDKAFCRELVYGTVRRLNTLDWALDSFAEIPVSRLSAHVRAGLRLGAHQILFMTDRVPVYAAVNESVELAKKHTRPGVVAFVNGVLRTLERQRAALPWPPESADPVRALSIRHSHPAWLVRRWLDRLGREETERLLAKNNEPVPLSVRVNTLAATRAGLFRALLEEGVEPELSRVGLDGLRFGSFPSLQELPSFRRGAFLVQDESSQIAVDVLDPRPGDTVADLCAAPGGKSTHIAQRLLNRGTVLAFDVNLPRLRLLMENAERLGATSVQPFLMDAREAGKKYMGAADRLLVDAPCSGLGVVRRRPDVRWNKTLRDVDNVFPPMQFEILKGASYCLKPGGVLVYAVCSAEREENEAVIERFLAEVPYFTVESAAPSVVPALQGAVTPEGFLRLLPHRHDTDGFFVARLRRNA